MNKKKIEIFYPPSLAAWRKWLEQNHVSKQAVWLVTYKKSSKIKTSTWSEAIDIPLGYGWIDSKKNKS